MSKIVLVETLSQFRHVFAVELPDDAPKDWALDTVVSELGNSETNMSEFAQEHIGEHTFSHRVIDKDEYLRMFNEMNGYLSDWEDEKKMEFIYKVKDA